MKNFKYLLIMIVALAIPVSSCSTDDDNDHDYHLEYVNVISAELPDEFNHGSTYKIEVTIALPNSCYFYYDQYDYIYDGTTRLIYPIGHVDDGASCNQIITETTFSIPVEVLQSEPYIFKFYQGKDPDGEDMFLTIEVPVI
ncbi:hypothetical protein [Flavivirga spongiicola]|uniref:DUF4625 domain-containing protein n=1 Tax=Flavivirga spongiicola TaxID=421621 RepID=A0ABU7XUT1_9FLAO|nr:hypothetical protein [Flavivirga sp. MEBiC05379]MDO5979541.1 hypothetical protein [Flavivirga sp. MEBiC05379]